MMKQSLIIHLTKLAMKDFKENTEVDLIVSKI